MAAKSGSKHHFAKLNDDRVREARRKYRAGGTTILELSHFYGVEMSTMGYALSGRTWKHVGNDGT